MATDPNRRSRRAERTAAAAPRYFSPRISSARRFYLTLAPRADRGLSVISGGWERCRADYAIRRSGFPHPTMEFVARGSGRLRLGGETTALNPGVAFVYGPRVPQFIESDPTAPMLKYFVVFDGPEGRALLDSCDLKPGSVRHLGQPERVRQVWDLLIDHGLGDHEDRQRLCVAALEYLIVLISSLAVPAEDFANRAWETYQRCRAFIEDEHPRIHSLRDIERNCHATGAYICRLFKRYGRQGPMEFARHLQMNKAVNAVLLGRRKLSDVSQSLGFSDRHSFSRSFRQVFGVPPTVLRELGRAGPEGVRRKDNGKRITENGRRKMKTAVRDGKPGSEAP